MTRFFAIALTPPHIPEFIYLFYIHVFRILPADESTIS